VYSHINSVSRPERVEEGLVASIAYCVLQNVSLVKVVELQQQLNKGLVDAVLLRVEAVLPVDQEGLEWSRRVRAPPPGWSLPLLIIMMLLLLLVLLLLMLLLLLWLWLWLLIILWLLLDIHWGELRRGGALPRMRRVDGRKVALL